MTAALLTLADSRLPAGGHTHSGGVEQAIASGVVHDPGSLAAFLLRRLATSGAVAAGLAAMTRSSSGRHRGPVPSPTPAEPHPVVRRGTLRVPAVGPRQVRSRNITCRPT